MWNTILALIIAFAAIGGTLAYLLTRPITTQNDTNPLHTYIRNTITDTDY